MRHNVNFCIVSQGYFCYTQTSSSFSGCAWQLTTSVTHFHPSFVDSPPTCRPFR
eukprot:m.159036 g.159036  ORF g.159036 m.159036 type:complete len:54 (-) comp15145_c0_seq4:2628-2789(-)